VVVTGVGAAAEPDKKIGAADAALRAPGPVVAANESRRADSGLRTTDSITAAKVVDRGANVDSLVRQRAALSPRLAMEPLRTDTGRAPAPAAEMARRSVLAGQASGAGLRLADAASVAGACYQLRVVPSVGGRPSVVADTVRLLDEAAPERSDPSWRRARAVGASPSSAVLLWREIDSVTVELQARGVSDTSVVRFRTTGTLPDVRSVSGARAAFAVKVACP